MSGGLTDERRKIIAEISRMNRDCSNVLEGPDGLEALRTRWESCGVTIEEVDARIAELEKGPVRCEACEGVATPDGWDPYTRPYRCENGHRWAFCGPLYRGREWGEVVALRQEMHFQIHEGGYAEKS